MAISFIVKEIERLSSEEGLNDNEIADIIGCSRATVNRTRLEHDIPRANLQNKKDKVYECNTCLKSITIRRKERRKTTCPDCESKRK